MSKDIETLKQRFPGVQFKESNCVFNGDEGCWVSITKNEMVITDPFSSDCSRFEVDPVDTYGIAVDAANAMYEVNAARAAAKESAARVPQPQKTDPFAAWTVFTGGNCTAWRIDIAAENGAHVLVTDEGGMAPPENPEEEEIVLGAYDDDREHGVITVEGRKGLNDWYQQSVGYSPDADNGAPLPMAELLALVAEVFYLEKLKK